MNYVTVEFQGQKIRVPALKAQVWSLVESEVHRQPGG